MRMIMQNFFLLVFVVSVIYALDVPELPALLRWSWVDTFVRVASRFNNATQSVAPFQAQPQDHSDHTDSESIITWLIELPLLGTCFLYLLMRLLPFYAEYEEKEFREGTQTWKEGVLRSLEFGFLHCIMGVPLFVGMTLTIPGLWLTYQYFQGGIQRSTAHHLCYNRIVFSVVGIPVLIRDLLLVLLLIIELCVIFLRILVIFLRILV